MFKNIKVLSLALAVAIGLTGCPAAILGGAAAGAKVGFDRRSTGAQTDDNVINLKTEGAINSKLNENRPKDAPSSSVKILTYNRGVLMMGVVLNEDEKLQAERIVRAQPNVRKVYNQLSINPSLDSRGFGDTSKDTWITSKVRTNILAAKGFSPNHVKVVTYNGVTYALGILKPDEQSAAARAISETSGVQKVVLLFEIYTE